MNSPYFFSSIADEVRAKHRPDFVDSRDLHPPLDDVAGSSGEPVAEFEVIDQRITKLEWCLFLGGGLLAIFASYLHPYWITR